jgi:hypothetical protein
MHCKDSPTYILEQPMCLFPLSKETDPERLGELRLVFTDEETCDDGCHTRKTIHQLELPLRSSNNDRCDSPKARLLDGRLQVCDLTHALADADFDGRGWHGGTFTWLGQRLVATGTLSGITNAGTHRKPVFDPACQECHQPTFLEGRFCGVIRRATADPALIGCQVFGAYRLQFEGSLREQSTRIRGVLEGLIVCECQPEQPPA